jgi:hypothetical protein
LHNSNEGEHVVEPNMTTSASIAYTCHSGGENGVHNSTSGAAIPASSDENQEQVNNIATEDLSTEITGDCLPPEATLD